MNEERLTAGEIIQGMKCTACMVIALPMKFGDRAAATEFCENTVNCKS